MSFANVILYIALIGYILYGKAKGWPMKAPEKLFVLPVLLVIIGYGDATHGSMSHTELALTVVGCAVSLGLGILRGRADKISIRNGVQYVQWGVASFVLFASNIAIKLIFDIIGVAAGSTLSDVSKSLILTLGLTTVGEAIALLVRSDAGARILSGGGESGAFGPRPSPTQPGSDLRDGAAAWLRQRVDEPRAEHHHDHDHDRHDHHHREDRYEQSR